MYFFCYLFIGFFIYINRFGWNGDEIMPKWMLFWPYMVFKVHKAKGKRHTCKCGCSLFDLSDRSCARCGNICEVKK